MIQRHLLSFGRMYIAALAGLFLLSGCETFGAPKPESFNERLAAGYISVTQVRSTATVLLQSNILSVDDAQQVQQTADTARAGLDVARAYGASPRGEDKLASTLVILTSLQNYLTARSPK